MFLAVAPCHACANRVINFVWGGGCQVYIFSKDPPVFGRFPQELRDQRRVWGSAENFDKDLLVLDCDSLPDLCK